MSGPPCRICGYKVFPTDDGSNRLVNGDGETDCAPPFWVVRNKDTGAAVTTVFREYNGQTARQRALDIAKRKPSYKAVRINPHGHITK